jgi:hypothetical protein
MPGENMVVPKKYLTKILFAMLMILVFFIIGLALFRRLWVSAEIDKQDRASFFITVQNGQRGSYGFGRMIALVETCQKVKDLEYLYNTRAIIKPQIESETICELIKSLAQERMRFIHHIDHLKSRAREPLSTKKMRSLSYYLHVLEESIQDMEMIITNRTLPADRKR